VANNLTTEDAATYLLGPVLGLLLRLRGVTCLHASAVALADRAIAFVGSEGAGKSTTAALLARKGLAIISDDVVALVERDALFTFIPAYPYLSLWLIRSPWCMDQTRNCQVFLSLGQTAAVASR